MRMSSWPTVLREIKYLKSSLNLLYTVLIVYNMKKKVVLRYVKYTKAQV